MSIKDPFINQHVVVLRSFLNSQIKVAKAVKETVTTGMGPQEVAAVQMAMDNLIAGNEHITNILKGVGLLTEEDLHKPGGEG